MSDAIDDSFIDDISENQDFWSCWRGMRELGRLWLPVGWKDEIAVEAGDKEALVDFIDRPGVAIQQGFLSALAYTSVDRADRETTLEPVDADVLIHRSFRSGGCQGITFNPPKQTDDAKPGFTMHAFAMPRLVGLLRTETAELDLKGHLEAAQAAQEKCLVYEELFHAVQARELSPVPEAAFPFEFDALIALGLVKEAASLFEWVEPKCQKAERLEIPRVRLMTFTQQPDQALRLLRPLMIKNAMNPSVWLERARALFRSGKTEDARVAFDQCLQREDDNLDALLGRGIALRTLHFESGNREGLEASMRSLAPVAEKGGYYRAEALHHMGTIHLAWEDYQEAESCFRRSLELTPSNVGRRNIAIVCHAQGKTEEGKHQYAFLARHYPSFAEGLDKYFPRPTTYFLTASAPGETTAPPPSLKLQAEWAGKRLRKRNIVLKDDILDFRRLDEYINYYAPAGQFISGSELAGKDDHDVQMAMLDCALHLGHVLVESAAARWKDPEGDELSDAALEFTTGHMTGTEMKLFYTVMLRLDVGAGSDNLTNLEMLVSMLPGYSELLRQYQTPYPTFRADESELDEIKRRCRRAHETMQSFGFLLDGTTNDLRQIDLAIQSFFDENSEMRKAHADGRFSDSDIEDLGLYVGSLFKTYAGGEWHSHSAVYGYAIKETLLQDFYPVWTVARRMLNGPEADGVTALYGLESPMVCAKLARKVKAHEINTREELKRILARSIPSASLEDPSGKSVERLADMVSLWSGVGLK